MMDCKRWIGTLAVSSALAFSAAPALADDLGDTPVSICVPVGSVASLAGSATAQLPGAAPRSIACGDEICAGDVVSTGAASSAGLLVGDVLTQLDAESTATIDLTLADTADVTLSRGGVRVLDPSGGDAPARLSAIGASGRVVGNDAEGYVLSEKSGNYAMLCEWDQPLEVTRGGQSAIAAPGECVVAKNDEALYTAPGHPERIPALADTCEPLSIGPLAHLAPLPIVASPPGVGPQLPDIFPFPPPSPCDDPGVACSGIDNLNEQKPTDDGFPGDDGPFDPTL